MKVEELREKYPIFEYKSFTHEIQGDNFYSCWTFACGELEFHPQLIIHGGGVGAAKLGKAELDNLVFHVGLADIFSYWKPTCSPKIKISAGKLTGDQIKFWHNLLIKGMGQYFYTNQIDFKTPDFVTFESSGPEFSKSQSSGVGLLIPVGGGKDSAVTLELLKKQSSVGAVSMNVSWSETMLPAAKRLMDEAGIEEQIFAQRILDPKLKELKAQGYLDGHIPFLAYLSFLYTLVAELFGYSQVVFSNERSSNEANLEYLNEPINHQYSKSFEFEQFFRNYSEQYLSKVNTFSFLRPLYELQIMKYFSQPQMNKYYTLFRSCNIGYKNDSWCGSCSKCLSVFVGLFPFVKTETLVKIFGKNLFEDDSLLPLVKDVLGLGSAKPFECIGTFDETKVAFYLSIKKYGNSPLPTLLQGLESKLGDLSSLSAEVLGGFDDKNSLPPEFSEILKKAVKQ